MSVKYDVILGKNREADSVSGGVISVNGMTGVVVINNASSTDAGLMSANDKTKLDGLSGGYKGFFATQAALLAKYPVGDDGWFVTAGWTDTIWSWDSDTSAWVNTHSASVNPTWDNIQNKPTTISGYGITDAKIQGQVITIGENSVTVPSLTGYATELWVTQQGYLTEHQSLAGYQTLITESNKLDYSLLANTPTIPSLTGYATETWVTQQGYLTEHQSLAGYQTLITESNKLDYSLLANTPTIPSLTGYATETWVTQQGYLTEHQSLAGYQTLITESNKLDYSLLANTPTIPSLTGYATESWVTQQGYLTEHQSLANYQTLITTTNKLSYNLLSDTPTIPTQVTYDSTNVSSIVAGTNVTMSISGGALTISASGSGTQLQSDWNQTDTTASDYIKNKPTIPAGTLEITATATSDISGTFDKTAAEMRSAIAAGKDLIVKLTSSGTVYTYRKFYVTDTTDSLTIGFYRSISGTTAPSDEVMEWYSDSNSYNIYERESEEAFRLYLMPTASSTYSNRLFQYCGVTNENYTEGHFYKVVENSGTYSWQEVSLSGNAASVSISDSGSYFTNTNVEGALQEIGATLNGLENTLEEI